MVWDLGVMVQGMRFMVQDRARLARLSAHNALGFQVYGSGFQVVGLGQGLPSALINT